MIWTAPDVGRLGCWTVEELLDGIQLFVDQIAELDVGDVGKRIALHFPAEVMRTERSTAANLFAVLLTQIDATHGRVVE